MEYPVESTLLEYEKSSFLIDLMTFSSGLSYIKIRQTIYNKNKDTIFQELKINPGILPDILEVLSSYGKKISAISSKRKKIFTPEKIQNLIRLYMKGITIEDLALYFSCSRELIIQILNNKDLPIVENRLIKGKKGRGNRKNRFK